MKKALQALSVILALGFFFGHTASAQCVEVGDAVGELSANLKEVGGFCGPAAVETNVCDCPEGFVVVGYEGLEGNVWGGEVLSQFSLRCKQVNPDGSLGAAVQVTCSNGTGAGNQADGPVDAGPGEAIVGFEMRLGCAVDAIMGASKPLTEVATGDANNNSNSMPNIGGTGGSPRPVMYVPDGNVIVGMRVFEDPSTNLSGGVAWRYAPINAVACSSNCSISGITASNISACDNGGTDDVANDDTFTADITVTYFNAPAGGDLVLGGDANVSVPVASIGANAYTFTGVTMPADGSAISIVARFSQAPGCDLSRNVGASPVACSPDAPAGGIPTMSEWGLILFALILFTLTVVFGTQHQRAMAIAGGGQAPVGQRSRLPFHRALYLKVLPWVYLAFGLAFAGAVAFTGYELTGADLPGSLLSGAVIAYLLHFAAMPSGRAER